MCTDFIAKERANFYRGSNGEEVEDIIVYTLIRVVQQLMNNPDLIYVCVNGT